jgi:hypothetical protein
MFELEHTCYNKGVAAHPHSEHSTPTSLSPPRKESSNTEVADAGWEIVKPPFWWRKDRRNARFAQASQRSISKEEQEERKKDF